MIQWKVKIEITRTLDEIYITMYFCIDRYVIHSYVIKIKIDWWLWHHCDRDTNEFCILVANEMKIVFDKMWKMIFGALVPVAYDRQNFPYRYFIVLSIYWLYVPPLWSRAAFSFRRNEKRAFYKYSPMGYTMVILLSTLVLFLFDYLRYTLYIFLTYCFKNEFLFVNSYPSDGWQIYKRDIYIYMYM